MSEYTSVCVCVYVSMICGYLLVNIFNPSADLQNKKEKRQKNIQKSDSIKYLYTEFNTIFVYIYVFVYIYLYIWLYIYTYTYIYICMYVCIYIRTHMCNTILLAEML